MDKIPKGDRPLIIGELNAQVGIDQHLTNVNVVGPRAVDAINENGKHLVDICSINNLIICNIFFQQDTNTKKHKEWLTEEIMDIVNKKSIAFLQWQNFHGTALESKYHNNYCRYRIEI